jgi:hypothetical protein
MSVSQSHADRIGGKFVLQLDAPSQAATVVFEDDGDTGYFYALAPTPAGELELLDALHVYNAEAELRGTDIRIEIAWSDDGARAGLRVNASLWALFDFSSQSGWSRSNFPPPAGRWRMGEERPAWSDALVKLL